MFAKVGQFVSVNLDGQFFDGELLRDMPTRTSEIALDVECGNGKTKTVSMYGPCRMVGDVMWVEDWGS